jgi:hypothetical protein
VLLEQSRHNQLLQVPLQFQQAQQLQSLLGQQLPNLNTNKKAPSNRGFFI